MKTFCCAEAQHLDLLLGMHVLCGDDDRSVCVGGGAREGVPGCFQDKRKVWIMMDDGRASCLSVSL